MSNEKFYLSFKNFQLKQIYNVQYVTTLGFHDETLQKYLKRSSYDLGM